jgi:hypothetical protein
MTENRADLSHNLRSQTSTEAHLKASRYNKSLLPVENLLGKHPNKDVQSAIER